MLADKSLIIVKEGEIISNLDQSQIAAADVEEKASEEKCFKKKIRRVNWVFEEQPKEVKLIQVNVVQKNQDEAAGLKV